MATRRNLILLVLTLLLTLVFAAGCWPRVKPAFRSPYTNTPADHYDVPLRPQQSDLGRSRVR